MSAETVVLVKILLQATFSVMWLTEKARWAWNWQKWGRNKMSLTDSNVKYSKNNKTVESNQRTSARDFPYFKMPLSNTKYLCNNRQVKITNKPLLATLQQIQIHCFYWL